jgi:hypothetical protein
MPPPQPPRAATIRRSRERRHLRQAMIGESFVD